MNATRSIARRFVIFGVLASFLAIAGPAAMSEDDTSARAARERTEVRYARLDPSAVLGGHDGLMPAAERDRPDQWDGERRRRRSEPTEPRGEERGGQRRDAERTRGDRS